MPRVPLAMPNGERLGCLNDGCSAMFRHVQSGGWSFVWVNLPSWIMIMQSEFAAAGKPAGAWRNSGGVLVPYFWSPATEIRVHFFIIIYFKVCPPFALVGSSRGGVPFAMDRMCLTSNGCGSKPMLPFWGSAPPILVYSSWDWDVHWGYGILTHSQIVQCTTACFGCSVSTS